MKRLVCQMIDQAFFYYLIFSTRYPIKIPDKQHLKQNHLKPDNLKPNTYKLSRNYFQHFLFVQILVCQILQLCSSSVMNCFNKVVIVGWF